MSTKVAQCTQPGERQIYTISFRSFSPMPGSIEFEPGKVLKPKDMMVGNDLAKKDEQRSFSQSCGDIGFWPAKVH